MWLFYNIILYIFVPLTICIDQTRRALVIVLPCYGALEIVGVIIIIIIQSLPLSSSISGVVVLESRQGRKLQFSDRQLQIQTEDIMAAECFNFAPNFPKMGNFQPQIVFLEVNFPTG